MTQVGVCSVSRMEMVKPVKNILCGHVYDMHSIEALLKQNPIYRCPVVGCHSKRAVVRSNLWKGKETKGAITVKRSK